MRIDRRALLTGIAATGLAAPARAAAWPDKPMVWIVPSAPGGPLDAFGRPVAAHVAEKLGQPVVIDNRSGAGGTIGIAMAARAPADGYTMVIGATSITYLQTIYRGAGFDLPRDLVPVSALARIQLALVVNPQRLDVTTLSQFIEAARKAPESIDFGSPGLGTTPVRMPRLVRHDDHQPAPTATAHPRHHRTDRNRKNLRHLLTRKSFNHSEQQHGPLLDRQRVQPSCNIGRRRHIPHHRVLVSERHHHRLDLPALRMKNIDHDPKQPGSRVGSRAELREAAPGREHRLLD